MSRTAHRPVASGRVSPRAALVYGIVLGVASFVLLATTVNLLAAALSLSGLLGYVFVYTLWLKRSTPQNIVIGGAAGAVPPLVAWAAVTGELSGTAFYLFAIVFFWTPPHFWALSLLMKERVRARRRTDAPRRARRAETRRQILLCTILLYAVTQLPFCAGAFGVPYLVASVGLGAVFIYGAWRLTRVPSRRTALRLYLYSLAYLAALFTAMALDPAVAGQPLTRRARHSAEPQPGDLIKACGPAAGSPRAGSARRPLPRRLRPSGRWPISSPCSA